MKAASKVTKLFRAGEFVLLVPLLLLTLLAPASAVTLAPGDILVSDYSAFGSQQATGPGGVIRVDPTSGAQTVISSAGSFSEPVRIAINANGDIFVSDQNNGVFRVDSQTGAQTLVSAGGYFIAPFGIAIAANGDLLVADAGGSVLRVDPTDGTQTVVATLAATWLLRPGLR
jgi:streptogramin lyase